MLVFRFLPIGKLVAVVVIAFALQYVGVDLVGMLLDALGVPDWSLSIW